MDLGEVRVNLLGDQSYGLTQSSDSALPTGRVSNP